MDVIGNVLLEAEKDLPRLLKTWRDWRTLDINYHPPRVERLWQPYQQGTRILLHCIHPCTEGDALLHPHPWPSAMRIYQGQYKMLVGAGAGVEPPPVVLSSEVDATPKTLYRYTMTHPDGWHAVIPTRNKVYSLMVIGKPWDRPIPAVTEEAVSKLPPLSRERTEELVGIFRAFAGK